MLLEPRKKSCESLRPSTLIGWSATASVFAAAAVAGLIALAVRTAPDEALRTAALGALTSAVAAALSASLVVRLGGNRTAAFGVLASSIGRMVAAIAIGVVVQKTLGPAPAPFWASIIAGWLAAKVVEVRFVWPGVIAPSESGGTFVSLAKLDRSP